MLGVKIGFGFCSVLVVVQCKHTKIIDLILFNFAIFFYFSNKFKFHYRFRSLL